MLQEKMVRDLVFDISSMLKASDSIGAFLWHRRADLGGEIVRSVCEDHAALLARDPAYGGRGDLPLVPNAPFRAVVAYRTAHALWMQPDQDWLRLSVAIQHLARVNTGIDIHPGARIGRRFIVDHGSGTVIGETAVIGDDCYVLNGVTIGARGIAANAAGRRHPTIGHRAEIGSFARVLGPIVVGDDVFIAPLACVSEDIPDGARVKSSVGRPHVKLRLPVPLGGAKILRAAEFARS